MHSIDEAILMFFVEHRAEWISVLMLIVTYAGGMVVATTVIMLAIIFFAIHNHQKQIAPLLVSVCGTTVTVFSIKNFLGKARPLAEAFYLEQSFSFPSGHAALAVALYGFFIYLIWQHEKHHLQNKVIWGLGIFILLIGLSRLYLGVHFLSDILAGYAVGFIWLSIAICLRRAKII